MSSEMLPTNIMVEKYINYCDFLLSDRSESQDIANILNKEMAALDDNTKLLVRESHKRQIPIFTFDSFIRKQVLTTFALENNMPIPDPITLDDFNKLSERKNINTCLIDRIDIALITGLGKIVNIVGGTCYMKNDGFLITNTN